MRSFRTLTFGCKANQYDTQVVREALRRRGWVETERAAVVLVNTCAVTAEAARKARQKIRAMAREREDARIVVMGCLATAEPEELARLPNVAAVVGNANGQTLAGVLRALDETPTMEDLGLPPGITEFEGRTRAFVKIQDGCDQRCAFCIIPSTRGANRSRPIASILPEVAGLVDRCFREIVLCGIHIGHWGRDLGVEAGLGALLRALEEIPGEFRVRLSSIEATEVEGPVLDALAQSARGCAHLHMPLQSGDDGVLAAMNRWYAAADYLRAVERIAGSLPSPAFTTDVLVGFPGETESAFENTMRVVEAAGFCRVHVFPFSPRPGTAAAAMGGAVPPEAVRERRAALSELVEKLASRYRESLVGGEDRVLVESEGVGLSDRYQRVRVAGLEAGRLGRVRYAAADEGGLDALLLEDP
jgi:threonylcarbamoyladenosine tRNA methylthiotransferase MtaB